MLKRILTAIVALCILIPVLIFADSPVFPVALSFVAAVAVYEVLHCVGLHKNVWISVPLYFLALVAPVAVRYLNDNISEYALVAILLLLLYTLCGAVLSHKKAGLAEVMTVFVTSLYAISGLSCIVYVYDIAAGGKYFYLLIFIGAWVTDTFAYFTGRFFGRHKLIPEVSPKKTVEGSIGGIVFCVIAFVIFAILFDLSVLTLSIVGLTASIVSQFGDLSMSLIKRHWGIKDYGKLFPGHGGVLDRFDSVLAVSILLAAASSFV